MRLSSASGGWPLLARGGRELFHCTNPPLAEVPETALLADEIHVIVNWFDVVERAAAGAR